MSKKDKYIKTELIRYRCKHLEGAMVDGMGPHICDACKITTLEDKIRWWESKFDDLQKDYIEQTKEKEVENKTLRQQCFELHEIGKALERVVEAARKVNEMSSSTQDFWDEEDWDAIYSLNDALSALDAGKDRK